MPQNREFSECNENILQNLTVDQATAPSTSATGSINKKPRYPSTDTQTDADQASPSERQRKDGTASATQTQRQKRSFPEPQFASLCIFLEYLISKGYDLPLKVYDDFVCRYDEYEQIVCEDFGSLVVRNDDNEPIGVLSYHVWFWRTWIDKKENDRGLLLDAETLERLAQEDDFTRVFKIRGTLEILPRDPFSTTGRNSSALRDLKIDD